MTAYFAIDKLEKENAKLREALESVLSELGPCNDLEKARGRCAGHPMLIRLPCPVGIARKLVGFDKESAHSSTGGGETQ